MPSFSDPAEGLGYPAVGAFDKNIRGYRYARARVVSAPSLLLLLLPLVNVRPKVRNELFIKERGQGKAEAHRRKRATWSRAFVTFAEREK